MHFWAPQSYYLLKSALQAQKVRSCHLVGHINIATLEQVDIIISIDIKDTIDGV